MKNALSVKTGAAPTAIKEHFCNAVKYTYDGSLLYGAIESRQMLSFDGGLNNDESSDVDVSCDARAELNSVEFAESFSDLSLETYVISHPSKTM